jgi:hypothetical protein
MDRPEERLALIELYAPQDAHVRERRAMRTVDVHAWPVSLGRALDCTVVLDDPHVAPHHASLARDTMGQLEVQVGDTANGVLIDGQPWPAGSRCPLPAGGAQLQIGATQLRLRLPGAPMAPERRLVASAPVRSIATLAVMALVLLASMWAGHWLSLDPGADLTAWLPVLMGLPLAVALWCGAWALASKLFQHRFDFRGHLAMLLPWLLAIELLGWMWPQATAALGAASWWALAPALAMVLAALLVRSHLLLVLPQHPRGITAAVVAVLLAVGGASLANIHRSTDRYTRAPYMSTLPLPALRLHGLDPTQALLDDMAPLRDKLAARAGKARRDEPEDDSDEE